MVTSILGLYPPDPVAPTSPSQCDNRKCLQTLPSVPGNLREPLLSEGHLGIQFSPMTSFGIMKKGEKPPRTEQLEVSYHG